MAEEALLSGDVKMLFLFLMLVAGGAVYHLTFYPFRTIKVCLMDIDDDPFGFIFSFRFDKLDLFGPELSSFSFTGRRVAL